MGYIIWGIILAFFQNFRRGHMMGVAAATAALCAQCGLDYTTISGLRRQCLFIAQCILIPYLFAMLWIDARNTSMEMKWPAFPSLDDEERLGRVSRQHVYRAAKDGRLRAPTMPPGVKVMPPGIKVMNPLERVKKLVQLYWDKDDSCRVVKVTTSGDSVYWHVEKMSTFWGFIDDIAVRLTEVSNNEERHVLLEWHSRSRWPHDWNRGELRLKRLINFIGETI